MGERIGSSIFHQYLPPDYLHSTNFYLPVTTSYLTAADSPEDKEERGGQKGGEQMVLVAPRQRQVHCDGVGGRLLISQCAGCHLVLLQQSWTA